MFSTHLTQEEVSRLISCKGNGKPICSKLLRDVDIHTDREKLTNFQISVAVSTKILSEIVRDNHGGYLVLSDWNTGEEFYLACDDNGISIITKEEMEDANSTTSKYDISDQS